MISMDLARDKTKKRFVYSLLGLSLLLVVIFGFGGYYASLGSDQYGLVHFAEHLGKKHLYSSFPVYNWFKPDWGPDECHFILHGNYISDGSRMYCKYAIGYPLILALGIRLFGLNSVFLANIFLLLLLLWFCFKLAQTIFKDRWYGPYLALSGMLLLLILINKVWSLALKPSRDLPALMFLVAGLFFGIRALGRLPRVNWLYLILGGFCLGYSVTVKMPYVLASLPVGLYLLAKLIGKVSWKKLVAAILLAGFFFLVGLLPVLTQNYLVEGNPFRPPRPEITKNAVMGVKGIKHPPPLWIGFLPTTGPDTLRYFGEIYGVSLTALMLIGLAAGWRSPEIKYLCLGVPLLFIVFYSMWVHLMVRYMVVAHPFLLILIAAGVAKVLDPGARKWVFRLGPVLIAADILVRVLLNRKYGLGPVDFLALAFTICLWLIAVWKGDAWRTVSRYHVLVCVLFALFLVKFGPAWFSSQRNFQLPQAKKFGRAVDRLVPSESVIFATKPVSQLISLFSGSYSIRSFEIERMGVGLKEGCQRILDRGTSLFLIDASGGRRDGEKYIPNLRNYFDLTPVGTLKGEDYFLTGQFGKPVCTIYEITAWNRKKVEVNISDLAEGEGVLMTLNTRAIWADYPGRSSVTMGLNGTPLDDKLTDGINFLHLPARLIHSPVSRLIIRSDRPLPRVMDFQAQSIWKPYTIQFGSRARIPDYFLLRDFASLHWQDKFYRRLLWNKMGEIDIPAVEIPHTRLIGEINIRNGRRVPRPVGLKVTLNGEEIGNLDLSRVGGWEKVRFVIPAAAVKSIKSHLGFFAYPRQGYRIPSPEDEWWGALSFKAVTVLRWLEKAFFSSPERSYVFLAFRIRPVPGREGGNNYRILVNDRTVKTVRGEGVQRMLLAPPQLNSPRSHLQAVASPGGEEALLPGRPVTWLSGHPLRVNMGGEEDWAFIESGFFDQEINSAGFPFRWSKQTAALTLPLVPVEGKDIRLTLKIRDDLPSAVRPAQRELKIWWDEKLLKTFRLLPGDQLYQLLLPVSPPHLGRLKLTSLPWRPCDYSGLTDDRRLGVMLNEVNLDYIDREKR